MPTENIIRKSRMDYIDIYIAFGIILMVMGHIGFGGKFDQFIHAFHMPMFFFISGFFYKEKHIDVKKCAFDKAKKLLTPYFVFGGVLLPLVSE
ncbi:acyltransferase family protein [Novisyntrophococcus fermenticellae]|uniref:acyltransferase family protein n=1 Tax=Novisyntrophococcus fermenticellae TaxID=2068655 RepID=UPI001E3BC428|nr:acyltransferase family protein [Novisyntrophococcus fermenticellae]